MIDSKITGNLFDSCAIHEKEEGEPFINSLYGTLIGESGEVLAKGQFVVNFQGFGVTSKERLESLLELERKSNG